MTLPGEFCNYCKKPSDRDVHFQAGPHKWIEIICDDCADDPKIQDECKMKVLNIAMEETMKPYRSNESKFIKKLKSLFIWDKK